VTFKLLQTPNEFAFQRVHIPLFGEGNEFSSFCRDKACLVPTESADFLVTPIRETFMQVTVKNIPHELSKNNHSAKISGFHRLS